MRGKVAVKGCNKVVIKEIKALLKGLKNPHEILDDEFGINLKTLNALPRDKLVAIKNRIDELITNGII